MSIITVQIGQCGNQVGEKLFETILSDCYDYGTNNKQTRPSSSNQNYVEESERRFFASEDRINDEDDQSPLLYARSVLVDMESKVVNKLLFNQTNKRLKFRPGNSFTQKKGSGNNWSYGYCENGPKSLSRVEEIVRRETERCDRLSGFLVCMSLAGGTGSGVGSYYTEHLRDQYPRSTILNSCVWPFSTGEVILQNYNILLTLNKLYEYSDGILLLENDVLHQICKRIYHASYRGASSAKKEIAFDDLNTIIGHQLASMIQPCGDQYSRANYLTDIVADLCSNNDYKLLLINNVPNMSKQAIEFSSFQWPGLYKNAGQLMKTGGYMDECLNWNSNEGNQLLAVSLFARGSGSYSDHADLVKSHLDSNYISRHFTRRVYSSPTIRLWHQANREFNKYEKSLTMVSNSRLPALKIDSLVGKAWSMYQSRAYVHQYTRYSGFDEQDFVNTFAFAEQLVKNYRSL